MQEAGRSSMGHSHACAELKGIHFERPLCWCNTSQPFLPKGSFRLKGIQLSDLCTALLVVSTCTKGVFQIERHSLQMFCTACSQLVGNWFALFSQAFLDNVQLFIDISPTQLTICMHCLAGSYTFYEGSL